MSSDLPAPRPGKGPAPISASEPSEAAAPTSNPVQTVRRESPEPPPKDLPPTEIRLGDLPPATLWQEPDALSPSTAPDPNTVLQYQPPVGSGNPEPTATHSPQSDRELSEREQEIEQSRCITASAIVGDHELIRQLGSGAFGTVWEAKNRHTGEHVAIKFFRADDAHWVKLLNEVGVVQKVEGCRGIVMVKEVRPDGPGHRPYYVMPLANGGSLAEWIKNAGHRSPQERVRWATRVFSRVAQAMAIVHRRGIHHCDLKPHNILLHATEDETAPEPWVADFGQAHLANDRTPAYGTLFYMPPDQIDAISTSAPPDPRWDVYALGAVIYEMITGAPPRRTPELVHKLQEAPNNLRTRLNLYREGIRTAPRPTAHRPYCDSMLAKIIDRCLDLQPERRPADAGELSRWLKARQRWRKNRRLLGWAVTATLIVATAAMWLGIRWANDVTHRMKENVTSEISKSLERTSGFASRAVEDRLQKHILLLERWAEDLHSHNPPLIPTLAQAAAIPRPARLTELPVVPPEQHQQISRWLLNLHRERVRLMGAKERFPTLGVMLVTADANSSQPESRGFFLTRVLQDGRLEDAESSRGTPGQAIYCTDLSFRDYFHVGWGDSEKRGEPHRVVHYSSIGRPFRSLGNDFTGHAIEDSRWKFNIVTPIWHDPNVRERVIALLVLGFDVELDLVPLLKPPLENSVVPNSSETAEGRRYNIYKSIKVIVTDHRGHWIWHPDARELIETKKSQLERLPSYPALVKQLQHTGAKAGPWAAFDHDVVGVQAFLPQHSDGYIDPVELQINNDHQEEIASFSTFDPYKSSVYNGCPKGGAIAPSRPWVLIAQIDKKTALQPLDDLERDILRHGSVTVVVMIVIAVVLWIVLVGVLRRQDLTSASE